MIEFQQLTRTYGDFTAVHPLTLTVDRGEVFGFLGPNGAGKTTTIRMMMGILVPSGGRALISGLDCHERRAVEMLAEFGLTEAVDEFAVNYSMGMKKKLGLACALVHDPEVLILDEPINGLDPRAARDVQDRLRLAAAAGKTIFMSTHLLDMAEKVCTRVGIIHKGDLVATGTMDELRARTHQNASLEEVFLAVTDEEAALATAPR
ncbi:MAG: transporter ATP-binding protein [Steroidobacteraceae bacterium]|nr:transporter ATP-binding protein [Steroidobacteraceae bacterium]